MSKTVLGHIDCPACGKAGGMRITPDKNGDPFGFCEDGCGQQLRVGGKSGRVRAFIARFPWAAAAPVTVTATVTDPIPAPSAPKPAPVSAPAPVAVKPVAPKSAPAPKAAPAPEPAPAKKAGFWNPIMGVRNA